MAKGVSIALALVLAAVLTHGIVYSVESERLEPSIRMRTSTYQGFFGGLLVETWSTWNKAHGLEPMSILTASQESRGAGGIRRVEQFSKFYDRTAFLVCPLLGFGLFWLVSRQKIGRQFWKPLSIAVLFSTPLQGLISGVVFGSLGLNKPLAEAARATVVLLLMMWSVRAFRIPSWHRKEIAPSIAA